MSKRRVPVEMAGMLSLLWLSAACDHTAEGVKQDTLAATAAASDGADKARRELEQQVDAFKTQTRVKLEELSATAAQLSAQTNEGIDESRRKLKAEIDETRAKLDRLSAKSGAELEQAKADLSARLADLGKRLDATVDEVGDEIKE
jgi:DNA anti-recombination protein RmuC